MMYMYVNIRRHQHQYTRVVHAHRPQARPRRHARRQCSGRVADAPHPGLVLVMILRLIPNGLARCGRVAMGVGMNSGKRSAIVVYVVRGAWMGNTNIMRIPHIPVGAGPHGICYRILRQKPRRNPRNMRIYHTNKLLRFAICGRSGGRCVITHIPPDEAAYCVLHIYMFRYVRIPP